ncbi:putative zinc-binding oxidoreductase ToxD [Cryphonectria parasitica EP155]|uniref:Zinc-binding oxidoreductase ToxD n=1 Tax=Cryphonectria parasitica (strain ATCC 38755 / EP155) TaxID=660469 RepID=A0A9P4XSR2_CRYP1|nr:putative zinc-binding oxidoreductase ToxD [Cryphonectria parasitica EP155]KAF3760258.1 putative zinc-binding oxidoreductase ToxD [Cryphonectria parasitica EP155]
MSSKQNFGLIRRGTGNAVLEPKAVPELQDDYILVRTAAVALNPTDWTTLDAAGDDGTLVGCDFAGVVEAVGSKVTKPFKKGDRIAGFGHGGNDFNPETGAFARYIAVKGDIQMHVPDSVSFEEASTTGVGVATAGYSLYYVLNLPWPDVDNAAVAGPADTDADVIFIYGGSTATGTVAIQFAKLSGWRVVTTCSPRNFDLVKGLGADLVFDYKDPDVGQKIRQATSSRITKVLDTVSVESSAAICAEAFGPDGGVYCNLLGVDCPRVDDVKSVFFLGYDMGGDTYKFEGETYEARPEAFEFARRWLETAEKLWAAGKWKAHPQRVGEGGLLGLLDGMQQMREGLVSGEKLVYRVDDTKWPGDSN